MVKFPAAAGFATGLLPQKGRSCLKMTATYALPRFFKRGKEAGLNLDRLYSEIVINILPVASGDTII